MRRVLFFLMLAGAVLALAAFATRPGPEAFEALLDRAVRARVADTDLDAGREPLPTLALAACKLRPTDCVQVLRQALEVTYDRRLLTTRATVRGLGRETTCIGVFGRFFCRRPLAG